MSEAPDDRPEHERTTANPPPGYPGVGAGPYGHPGYGQPGYGQPGDGQPGDGHPAYGQPAWGPPAAGPPPEEIPPPPPPLWTRFKSRYEQGPISVIIVVSTVAVWLGHEALLAWAHLNTDLSLADNGSGIHGQPWRLVTTVVVHFSLVHIGFNMFALWQIGPPVEKVIGRWVFLASYLLCGIGGGILSDIILKPSLQNGVLIEPLSGGASGAIFGLIGILIGNYLVTVWAEKAGRPSSQEWRFNPSAVRSLAIQGVLWIAISSTLIKGIDNWAHVGGAAVGLLIGGGVAWTRTAPATASSA